MRFTRNLRGSRLLLPLLLAICCGGFSARGQQLRMGRPVDLSEAGLRFTPFEQIPQLPVPLPSARVLVDRQSGERREVYRVDDLWRVRQTHALFTNEVGRIRIAEMMLPRPTEEPEVIMDTFIAMDDFHTLRNRFDGNWDGDSMRQWVETFTGYKATGFLSVPAQHAIPLPAREYRLDVEAGQTRAFLLRLQGRAGPRYMLFLFEWTDPASLPNLDAAMYGLLRSVSPAAAQPGFEPGEDLRRRRAPTLGAPSGNTPEFEEARQRVIGQIRSMTDWWYVEMPPYILVSDLPRSRRTLVDRIQRDLQVLRPRFMQLFPPVVEPREVSLVRVFADRQAYENYVGAESAWSLGVWMPSRKELVIASSAPGGSGQRTSEILSTAYHEAFHQYLFYALDQKPMPRWLDEGHAMLFDTITLNVARGTVVVNEDENRIRNLEYSASIGRPLDLVQLMNLSWERFYALDVPDSRWERQFHYSGAWAFVYFLRKAVPVLHAGEGYDRIIPRTVEYLLENPGDFTGATEAALRGIDRRRLQRDFDDFWSSRSGRSAARRHRLFN